MRRYSLLALLFLIIVASGCAQYSHVSKETVVMQSLPPPQLVEKNFGYKKSDASVEVVSQKPFGEDGMELLLRMSVKNKEIGRANYIVASAPRSASACSKLVVVLPIYNSEHIYPQKALSLRLLFREQKDTNVLVIKNTGRTIYSERIALSETPERLANEIVRATDAMRKNVIVARRFIDWVEIRKEICKDKIGIVGFSIGVPFAVNAMAVDSRIKAGVLVIGGGGLHNIFAYSEEGEMSSARKPLLKRFGWGKETFAEFLKPLLYGMNPETYAGNISPDRVLFINSTRDRYIPQADIERLWEALGKPKRMEIPWGHKFSFLSMTPLGLDSTNVAIDSFFEEKL